MRLRQELCDSLHTIWSAQAPGYCACLTLLLLIWLVPYIPSAASVILLSHRAEIEAVRTSTQHRQAREKERLQGIKEDEEMQDEAVPKQVVPFVVRVMRSGLLLPSDA